MIELVAREMECTVDFCEYSKKFYEPGQKLRAVVRLIASKAEKVNSKETYQVSDLDLRFIELARLLQK